ncbi:uncharacterized protein LOC135947021 [Cloeon dipterum]|uniref:uncharacterized protein LOC135947021 n=1 Tax=Cloeon dipterum TaxID=197152 RepID=UPI0032201FBF
MLPRFILILVCLFFATCSAQYNQYNPPYYPDLQDVLKPQQKNYESRYNGEARSQAAKNFPAPLIEYQPTIWELNLELKTHRKNTESNFQTLWHEMELINNRQISMEDQVMQKTKKLVQEHTEKFVLLISKKFLGELNNQLVKLKPDINKIISQRNSEREATKSNINMLQNEFGSLKNEQTYFKDELQRVIETIKKQDVKSNSDINKLKSQLDSDRKATKSNITTLRNAFGTLQNEQKYLKAGLQKFVKDELRNQDAKSTLDLDKLKFQLNSDWEATNSNITTLQNKFEALKIDQDNLKAALPKFVGELKYQDVISKSDIKKLKSQLDSDREATNSSITALQIVFGTLKNEQTDFKVINLFLIFTKNSNFTLL